MLYMAIYTYDPQERDEVIARRGEKGAIIPEGMKVIGEWSDMGGGRVFRLFEVADAKVAFAASYAWSDLGEIEIIPVMETEEVMRLISSK
jgi:hypothetical protein